MIGIKDMKMPKNCFECFFRYKKATNSFGEFLIQDCCFLTKQDICGHLKTRSQDCPLENVK